jgi:hypothetical protein
MPLTLVQAYRINKYKFGRLFLRLLAFIADYRYRLQLWRKQAFCPACQQARPINQQAQLISRERSYYRREMQYAKEHGSYFSSKAYPYLYPFRFPFRYAALEDPRAPSTAERRWYWACDECLTQGKAIPTQLDKQNHTTALPHMAYVNRDFVCEDCGCKTVFSASEQQHWFEDLQFFTWVYPKQCRACRQSRRARKLTNNELMAALNALDPNDPVQLRHIAILYERMGSEQKAKEFMARARNVEVRIQK